MDDPPLASLSLTHVHYNPDDPLSLLCAWLSLAPQCLCITYATLIWSTREAEVLLMFAGQMACEALNWCLKRYIKEERPRQMYGKGYGMPSSHAQFVAFFSISLSLFLLLRHRPETAQHSHPDSKFDSNSTSTANSNSRSTSNSHSSPTSTPTILSTTPSTLTQRLLLSLAALLTAAAVAGSRIYLSYHTPRQVLVGCGAGAAFAVFWYGLTEYLRHGGWVEWGLETQVARWCRMRDLVVGEDLVEAGWARWEERKRRRGVVGKQKGW